MKFAVIFPGIGYHCDKPLLYYSARIAKSLGMQIVKVSFHDLSGKKDLIGNEEKMEGVYKIARDQAEDILGEMEWDRADELVFLSKSLGTAVAASYARDHGLSVRHVYYTPVAGTFHLWRKHPGLPFTEQVIHGLRRRLCGRDAGRRWFPCTSQTARIILWRPVM